jgi:PilZ domain-containing protein
MTIPPVQVERRAGQRFPFLLSVFVRDISTGTEGPGYTQDISSRGVFFFTELLLSEGSEVELTLNMPSEITLGASMRVRCRGHVLRVVRPAVKGLLSFAQAQSPAETKIGVAVRLEGYEYLPDADEAMATFPRIAALHAQHDDDRPAAGPHRP